MLTRPRIHFVETANNFRQISGSTDWESGYWYRIGNKTAEALVGGHIYLHRAQKEPSFLGGVIKSFRIQSEGKHQGRYVFRFEPSTNGTGISADSWDYRFKRIVL